MPVGKGAKRGRKVTLTAAKKAIWVTPDGHRRLTLSNMGITIFPRCLLKLTNVDELDLSRNRIEKLPEGIGNFLSVRWLDLHSNRLHSVPESIGKLVALTHLNLSNNRLTSAGLPSSLGCLINLHSLNLGMNQLDSLPPTLAALDRLKELGLFDNLFTYIPDFVKGSRHLTRVNMMRNPLSFVQVDDEEVPKTTSELEEYMYLIHESVLCRTCLKRCKKHGDHANGDMFEEKRIRTYPGLAAPNSVAKVDQDAWRIRKVERKPIKR